MKIMAVELLKRVNLDLRLDILLCPFNFKKYYFIFSRLIVLKPYLVDLYFTVSKHMRRIISKAVKHL